MQLSSLDLLVLPCAGASATMYQCWRRYLPEWVRLVPIELPGRGSRFGEAYAENFEQLLAALCVQYAAPMQARYALFGHSMGGLFAYAMAQRQHALGQNLPLALFVSACPAPACCEFAGLVERSNEANLMADLRQHGGTPDELFANPEWLRMTLDVLRADYCLCASFRDQASASLLPVPVHVFAGREDAITPAHLQAWDQVAAGRFTLDWFEGGHFYLQPYEQQTIAMIVQKLMHVAT